MLFKIYPKFRNHRHNISETATQFENSLVHDFHDEKVDGMINLILYIQIL